MPAEARLDLQPRLQAIADWVPPGIRLADIGTDHGYLPVWLLQEGRILSAIAADIGEKPLLHAGASAERYGVRLDLRRCDGLSGILPEETDVIVIAGMGGETIGHILGEAPWTREGKLLLLQPMSKPDWLRLWLANHGYRIDRERLVMDKGVIYPILRCAGGRMAPPTPGLACYGYAGEGDPLFPAYLRQWAEKTRRALAGLERSENAGIQTKRRDMERLLKELEERSGERP